eukprot:scaffold1978_cov381-Prasinococcus_capsulatus_cf.AAC.9
MPNPVVIIAPCVAVGVLLVALVVRWEKLRPPTRPPDFAARASAGACRTSTAARPTATAIRFRSHSHWHRVLNALPTLAALVSDVFSLPGASGLASEGELTAWAATLTPRRAARGRELCRPRRGRASFEEGARRLLKLGAQERAQVGSTCRPHTALRRGPDMLAARPTARNRTLLPFLASHCACRREASCTLNDNRRPQRVLCTNELDYPKAALPPPLVPPTRVGQGRRRSAAASNLPRALRSSGERCCPPYTAPAWPSLRTRLHAAPSPLRPRRRRRGHAPSFLPFLSFPSLPPRRRCRRRRRRRRPPSGLAEPRALPLRQLLPASANSAAGTKRTCR